MMETEVLSELVEVICRVWVEDIVIKGHTPRKLLHIFVTVGQHLQEKRLHAAAHECHFSTKGGMVQ